MDDLLADFVAETREMLEAVEGELVAWETDPTDRGRLDAIFRFVHTVKGNCGFFDFPQLEKLSHAAETALGDVRVGRRSADHRLVSAILAIIDRITVLANAIEAGETLDDSGDAMLIAALDADSTDTHSLPLAPGTDINLANPTATAATPRSIRLPVGLLDRVMSGVSDMVLARNDLAHRLREAGNAPALDGPFERLSNILTDMREAVTRMRMQRIEQLYSALPRLVRDLAAELNKRVMVDFEGANVELDREMIDMIRDPITHLIRNAIDHGIELPAQRLAKGKRETGLLSITSRQSGNRIIMTIADDGAGLNHDRIGAKAVAAGLVTQLELDAMTPDQIANLIFEPGLSTAEHITGVSGRGVGMDVVRSNIEKLGGRITVTTAAGEGTRFNLELPLTLSIISALTVSISGQHFAIPHSYVEEIAHGRSASVAFAQVGDTDLVTFRGKRVVCLTLHSVLDVDPRRAGPDQRLVLIRLGGGAIFALAVDHIHDQEDLVIKPLSPQIMAAGCYAGTTLLDNGRPILMLDIPAIAERYGLHTDSGKRAIADEIDRAPPVPDTSRALITFTDFDGRQRALGLNLVARLDQVGCDAFDVDGDRVQVVIDDRIFDVAARLPALLPQGQIKVLRLNDGTNEMAYPVAELGETTTYDGPITPLKDAPGIEGIALIGGNPVPVLDGFAIFANQRSIRHQPNGLVCALPDNDEWTARILRPLVEAAGYRIAESSATEADVTLQLADAEGSRTAPDHCIILHADPEHEPLGPNHVYRYDRAAIIGALEASTRRKAS